MDKTIRIWDLNRPEDDPRILRGHAGPIRSLSLSTDGKTLISGSDDGTAREWKVSPPEPSERDPHVLVTRARLVAGRSNLLWAEWQQFFPGVNYRRTFDELPDGDGVADDQKSAASSR